MAYVPPASGNDVVYAKEHASLYLGNLYFSVVSCLSTVSSSLVGSHSRQDQVLSQPVCSPLPVTLPDVAPLTTPARLDFPMEFVTSPRDGGEGCSSPELIPADLRTLNRVKQQYLSQFDLDHDELSEDDPCTPSSFHTMPLGFRNLGSLSTPSGSPMPVVSPVVFPASLPLDEVCVDADSSTSSPCQLFACSVLEVSEGQACVQAEPSGPALASPDLVPVASDSDPICPDAVRVFSVKPRFACPSLAQVQERQLNQSPMQGHSAVEGFTLASSSLTESSSVFHALDLSHSIAFLDRLNTRSSNMSASTGCFARSQGSRLPLGLGSLDSFNTEL